MKKALSLLIVLAMLLAMMPAVFATEEETVESLNIGNNEMELPRAAEEASVYSFVAPETGTLYIAAVEFYYEASWTDGYEDNSYYMEDWTMYTIFTINGEALDGGYYGSVEVVAGETYTFSWSHNEHSTYGFKAVVNLSYTDELMPVPGIDMALRPSDLPMNTVEIPAGDKVFYQLSYEFDGYILTVTGENAYIYYEVEDWWTGETIVTRIDAVDGVVEFDFADHSSTQIYIGNDGTEAATFALDCYAPEGGLHNPYIVETLEEIELTIYAGTEGYTYFKWIATEVGTIWVTPGNYYVNFENRTSGEYTSYDETWENSYIYVEEGDELLIAITGWVEEDTVFTMEMVNYRFVPGYRAGSEENPFVIDLLAPLELNMYDKTVYYTWTPEQSMVVTIDFTLKYTWSTNIPNVTINGEAYTLGEELTVTAGEPVIMVLSTEPSVYGTLQATEVVTEEPTPDPEIPENGEVLDEDTVEVPASWRGTSKTYEMTADGTLYIVIDSYPEDTSVEYGYFVVGGSKTYYHTHSDGNVQSIEVLSGDTVKLELCLLGDNGNGGYVGGEVSYRLIFVSAESGEEPGLEGSGTETDPWIIESLPFVIEGTFGSDLSDRFYSVTMTEAGTVYVESFSGCMVAFMVNGEYGYVEPITVAAGDVVTAVIWGDAEGDYSVSLGFTPGEPDDGGDDEEKEDYEGGELIVGENIIGINSGEVVSPEYTFTAEVDGYLTLDVIALISTASDGITTEWTPEEIAELMENFYVYLQVNGEDYTGPVAVAAGETVTITMTQSRMYSGYGYSWEATLNLTFAEETETVMGDVTGDGVVNYLDAMLIAQYYVGDVEADALDVSAADVNGDGVVNYLDAMMIAQYYVGDIDSLEP